MRPGGISPLTTHHREGLEGFESRAYGLRLEDVGV